MRVYTDEEFEAKLHSERVRVIHAVLDVVDEFAKTSRSLIFYHKLHEAIVGILPKMEAPKPTPPADRAPVVEPGDGRGTE